MTETRPDQSSERLWLIPERFVWILVLSVILLLGLFMAANLPRSVHDVGPEGFARQSRPLLEGSLPYVDYAFEHLPLALLPMATAAVVEKLIPNVDYTIIFWAVMSAALLGVGHLTNQLGERVGRTEGALRWILISWPMLPMLPYRVDALSLLLALLTLNFAIDGRERASAWSMAGAIAAKGWPIVLVAVDWWRGRRRRAVLTVGATLAGAALLSSFPLFRSGRDFFGVHVETVTGSAVVFARLLRGLPPGTGIAAQATYVEVGGWAMIVNVAIGATIAIIALRVLTREFTWKSAIDLTGVLAIAIMVASPLLSAQFVIWLTPFAALCASRQVRMGAAGAALLTGVFVTFWYSNELWWWAIIVARNVFLIWTGLTWARFLSRNRGLPQPVMKVAASVGP